MNTKVLVAYASTHGSTQEIAETVTATLREHGLTVDLQPAKKVRSLEGYGAVVLGAPLYMLRLHRDAHGFLSRHRTTLSSGLPLAIFAGGPFGEGETSDVQAIRKNLDEQLAKYPWLAPVSVELVGGRFDPSRLRFPWNLLPGLKMMPASDLRDWEAIRGWASGLVKAFEKLPTL